MSNVAAWRLDLLHENAEQLEGLWMQRLGAERAPELDVNALNQLDRQIVAHGDALALAGAQAAPILDELFAMRGSAASAAAAFVIGWSDACRSSPSPTPTKTTSSRSRSSVETSTSLPERPKRTAMTRKQWVNFPAKDTTILSKKVVRSDYVDGDIESEHVMGPTVYVKVRYKKDGTQVPVTLTVETNGENAKYSDKERSSTPGVYGPTIKSATGIGSGGVAKFHVKLTPAGGDRYKFKAKSKKGTELVCKDEVETRRKLYYQIIRMKGAAEISAGDLSLVEKEFWNPGKKVYLKLEQYSPGGTIFDGCGSFGAVTDLRRSPHFIRRRWRFSGSGLGTCALA